MPSRKVQILVIEIDEQSCFLAFDLLRLELLAITLVGQVQQSLERLLRQLLLARRHLLAHLGDGLGIGPSTGVLLDLLDEREGISMVGLGSENAAGEPQRVSIEAILVRLLGQVQHAFHVVGAELLAGRDLGLAIGMLQALL